MSTTKHKEQHQEQAIGHQEQKQEQKQELPPDPVGEQRKAYSAPENAIASDPITEAPKTEPSKEPAKQTQEQKK